MSPEELQDLRRQLGEMRAAAGKGPAGGLGAAAAAAIGGSSVAAAAVAAAKAGVKRKKVGGLGGAGSLVPNSGRETQYAGYS
jgi:hypothetical protein